MMFSNTTWDQRRFQRSALERHLLAACFAAPPREWGDGNVLQDLHTTVQPRAPPEAE